MKNYYSLEFFGVILTTILVISLIGFLVFVVVESVQETQLDKKYTSGVIDKATYCDEKTDKGTRSTIPVICYDYYQVKQVGIKKVCTYNVALKMNTCVDKPILESTLK